MQIFVIDVAGGDKVPRKGGPGVTAADLLVVNKTDLAPLVGADLGRHAPGRRRRPGRQADAADLAARGPDGRGGGRVGARAGPGPRAAREDAWSRSSPGRGPGGRTVLPVMRASGQLAVRRTGPCTVHLVATAFGPLGGDDAEMSLVVEEGAALRRPVGRRGGRAACAGRVGRRSAQVDHRRGRPARCDLGPEPTVVAARRLHLAELTAELDRAGVLTATEQVLLGRAGEEPGPVDRHRPCRPRGPAAAAHDRRAGPGRARLVATGGPAGLCIHGAHR